MKLAFIFAILFNHWYDSLRTVIKSDVSEAEKIKACDLLIKRSPHPDTAYAEFKRLEKQYNTSESNSIYPYLCLIISDIVAGNGNFELGIEIGRKGVEAAKRVGNDSLAAFNLAKMGFFQYQTAKYEDAINACLEAIKYGERCKKERVMASAYNLMGLVFAEKNPPDYKRSLEYYMISEKMIRKQKIPRNLGLALLRIGEVHEKMNNFSDAEKYLNEALQIAEVNRLELITRWALEPYGRLYLKQNKLKEALDAYTRAYAISTKMADYIGITKAALSLADVHAKTGKYALSLQFCDTCIARAKYNSNLHPMMDAYLIKAQVLEKTGDLKGSVQNYKLHLSLKDSITNKEELNNLNELEKRYKSEKKEKELAEKDKELAIRQADVEKQSMIRNYFIAGSILLLGFLVLAVRSYRRQKKDRSIIEKQKMLVEVKQKEVLDSIRYAQRIQRSQMPNEKRIGKQLSQLRGKNS